MKIIGFKSLINGILKIVGLRVSLIQRRGEEILPHYIDEEFPPFYNKYFHYSMVSWQGMHDAFEAAKYIAQSNIEGDVVECGVWRGGVSALMRDVVLVNEHDQKRKFWLFDTYEGMPAPTELDYKSGRPETQALIKFKKLTRVDGTSDWCRGELSDVKDIMSKSGYGTLNVEFVRGMVEDTLRSEALPKKIALLRLDTDFYESTKLELEVLLPKLVTGGVLIIDDYGYWAGSKKAVDELKGKNNWKGFAVFRNHQNGALIAVKTN